MSATPVPRREAEQGWAALHRGSSPGCLYSWKHRRPRCTAPRFAEGCRTNGGVVRGVKIGMAATDRHPQPQAPPTPTRRRLESADGRLPASPRAAPAHDAIHAATSGQSPLVTQPFPRHAPRRAAVGPPRATKWLLSKRAQPRSTRSLSSPARAPTSCPRNTSTSGPRMTMPSMRPSSTSSR